VCLAIYAKHEHTYLLSYASGCDMSAARYGTAP
jgi:hypothetical protein